MIFSSVTFLFYFLPIVLIFYRFVPIKYKNIFLVLASLFFYAWGEPKYVLLMLFSAVVDYALGLFMERSFQKGHEKQARFYLICSIIVNLSLLFFFKYTTLFLSTLNDIGGFSLLLPNVALPIGISFYTFQTMSYSIDVYRKKVVPQHNFVDFAMYVTLFPQLIAGPIVRYTSIEKELTFRTCRYEKGIPLFLLGLGQKVLLANNMGLIWKEISAKDFSSLSILTAWLGIIAFAFQIYFDFCGYSNMAIGLGHMLGFHFPPNFDKPYLAKSITEFWHRWHISLSTWFKEYVYIPLGGNKKGGLLQLRNILIVWLLTGFWHGASWNFLLWGLYFAILLILEKLWLAKLLKHLPSFFCHVYALFFILLGWVLFAFDKLEQIAAYLAALFGQTGLVSDSVLFYLCNNLVLFLLAILCSTQWPERIIAYWKDRFPFYELAKSIFLIVIFLLSISYIVDSSFNPFLYFRF